MLTYPEWKRQQAALEEAERAFQSERPRIDVTTAALLLSFAVLGTAVVIAVIWVLP